MNSFFHGTKELVFSRSCTTSLNIESRDIFTFNEFYEFLTMVFIRKCRTICSYPENIPS